jgi:hypothetical protein
MKIDIQSNSPSVVAYFQRIAQRQLPYAMQQTLTSLAFKIRTDTHDEMRSLFDRPTPNFALRSIVVEKATKAQPWAWVGLRKDGGFRKALAHEMSGGTREWKKMEGAFLKLGMPRGLTAVPGEAAPLNSYGNMTAAYVKAMLNGLMTGVSKKRRGSGGVIVGFFMVLPGNKSRLHPGVWERHKDGRTYRVRPILMFVRSARYRKLIDLQRIGNETLARDGREILANQIARAIASDRQLRNTLSS